MTAHDQHGPIGALNNGLRYRRVDESSEHLSIVRSDNDHIDIMKLGGVADQRRGVTDHRDRFGIFDAGCFGESCELVFVEADGWDVAEHDRLYRAEGARRDPWRGASIHVDHQEVGSGKEPRCLARCSNRYDRIVERNEYLHATASSLMSRAHRSAPS
jgi:hypothetical protein